MVFAYNLPNPPGEELEVHRKRLKRLFKRLSGKADAVLMIGDGQLLRCLTGHGEGNAIATPRGVEFIVPQMLAEAAAKTGMKVHVHRKRYEYQKAAKKVVGSAKAIGLRFAAVSHPAFLNLKNTFRGARLVDITEDVAEVFLRKDEQEIESLKKACRYAAVAAKAVPSMMRSRMTEVDLMREINHAMKAIGGGMVSFGENTSHPHHQPGQRRLRKGDLVMVDFGCVVDGTGSDITRTFCYGRASKRQKEVYREVRRAQKTAFSMIREGHDVADINASVNEMFEKDGYGPFIHSIGHNLGFFGGGFRNVRNNVVTVEPGIYIPGFGGVRIEDDILITKQGFLNLTKGSPAEELIEV
jgi:Xaa-Pro dipeptidase